MEVNKVYNFYASILANGIHGGAVRITDEEFIFRCQKVSIQNEYKNLKINYDNILSINKKRNMDYL